MRRLTPTEANNELQYGDRVVVDLLDGDEYTVTLVNGVIGRRGVTLQGGPYGWHFTPHQLALHLGVRTLIKV